MMYSGLHIVHSYFNGPNGLVLEDNCNITMLDTTVEYQTHFHELMNTAFLTTSLNVQVNITNCTISSIPILIKAEHSIIFIDDSSICDSQSFVDTNVKYVIDILVSSLIISDTNITHNNPTGMQMFLSGSSNSHLEMYRCLYAWNSFSTHFMVSDNSDVIIQDSQFKNNNSTATILVFKINKCVINGCLFEDNKGKNIVQLQSSNVSFTNSEFLNTLEEEYTRETEGMVSIESAYVHMNNYLDINNCTFTKSRGNLDYVVNVTNVAEISIQNSYFQCWLILYEREMVTIDTTRTLRIANSKFVLVMNYSYIMSIYSITEKIHLYTFQSEFRNKRGLITTNETNLQ